MVRKTKRERDTERLGGLGRLFAVPRPSYSTAELVDILFDFWEDEKYALQKIRTAVARGSLRPFRRGTVNEFTYENVVRFVCSDEYPASNAELVNAALLSGFEFVTLPAALLLSTRDGWKPDPVLAWPPWGRSLVPSDNDEPLSGTRANPDFPAAARDSHMNRVDPHSPEDGVPHQRTRVRAASEPKSRKREKRQAELAARAARRIFKPEQEIRDEGLRIMDAPPDDEPAEISPEAIERVQTEGPAQSKRGRR